MLQMEAAIDSGSVISYACVEHQYTDEQLHTEGTRLKAEDVLAVGVEIVCMWRMQRKARRFGGPNLRD
jgi:hypothetical protein